MIPFHRRKAEDNFKPQPSDSRVMMYDYLEWMNTKPGISIQHRQNSNKEHPVDQYKVDGYDPGTNTIYEFSGCYYHGHSCEDKFDTELGRKRYADTIKRREHIVSKGYAFVEMWECEFKALTLSTPDLADFVAKRRPKLFAKYGYKPLREEVLLASVQNTDLYGMVECDIEVPEKWEGTFSHELTPYEYFAEMSPLFCTTDVSHDHFGEHMREYAREKGMSEKPRRLLVGGMKARKLLLLTPLLKWYLDHGLKVTKIHEVIEFVPQRCFLPFTREVTEARRLGDVDSSSDMQASTMKLIGESLRYRCKYIIIKPEL